MSKKIIYAGVVIAVICAPLTLVLHTFSPAPLPIPQPYEGPLPQVATPPKEMAVYSLVAGVNHRVAAFGYRGGSLIERRDFAMAAALVKHPKGDLLIDTGFGRNIAEQFRTLPFTVRAVTFYSLWRPAADQLRDAHYDRLMLRAILLTHSHWDHVSGLPDFPGVPVSVTTQEREFSGDGQRPAQDQQNAPEQKFHHCGLAFRKTEVIFDCRLKERDSREHWIVSSVLMTSDSWLLTPDLWLSALSLVYHES